MRWRSTAVAEPPRLGWYGDDFTGATDTLACLAQAGQRAMLFLRIPTPEALAAAGELDAIGIAGAARAMSSQAMDAELDPVGRFFAGQGVRVLHYKTCSTFDSAPGIGNIATAIAALHLAFPESFVPIVGGQPNIGRYCLFSTLFAAAGSGGEVHRLDRHPTMSAHPVTPMAEADLRRHLAQLGLPGVRGVHYPAYAAGLAAQVGQNAEAVLFDVATASDLAAIGALIWERALAAPLLAVGPSSVAQAVVSAWPPAPPPPPFRLSAAHGAVFVMVGSLSPVTRAQVAAAPSFTHLEITANMLAGDEAALADLRRATIAMLRDGQPVMVRTASPEPHANNQALTAQVSRVTADFVLAVMAQTRLSRMCIAGGDTSSQAASAMDAWGLAYVAQLSPGVTLCRLRSHMPPLDGLEIVLKGGQMGQVELFETLLHGA